jgi:hypothetical protein
MHAKLKRYFEEKMVLLLDHCYRWEEESRGKAKDA